VQVSSNSRAGRRGGRCKLEEHLDRVLEVHRDETCTAPSPAFPFGSKALVSFRKRGGKGGATPVNARICRHFFGGRPGICLTARFRPVGLRSFWQFTPPDPHPLPGSPQRQRNGPCSSSHARKTRASSSTTISLSLEIRGDKVRLGVEAPKEVPVHRREVYEAIARGEPVDQASVGGSGHEPSSAQQPPEPEALAPDA
jgi:carbon storage regulator CsrA